MSDDNGRPVVGLSEISDEVLLLEVARRRAGKMSGARLLALEDAAEECGHADSHRMMQVMFDERVATQDGTPKPCPKCGRRVWVRSKDRERTIRTMSGELSLRRHYHYCERCQQGFYPLDIELGLPEEGELSPKMTARVLDFAVTSVYAEAAARWSVHHSGSTISENVARLVVERAGSLLEGLDHQDRQATIRSAPEHAPSMLVVQTDGSMLSMRELDQWKEVKLGVIYSEDHHVPGSRDRRGIITEARYVTSMLGIDDFRLELDAALTTERALEAKRIAWIGDGAPWNWTLCNELCPNAIQVLDFMHMAQHAADCGKAVLGEQSPWLGIWTNSIVRRVETGAIDHLLADLTDIRDSLQPDATKAVDNLIRYYQTNAARMNYPLYRTLGLPIGSGAVESAPRHVLQNRMKLAGQHWSLHNAHRMAMLRSAYKTNGPDHFADFLLPIAA